MILIDEHCSHITSDVTEFCRREKIILIYLPPHTTHHLQPLDVSFFLPLANAYQLALYQKFCLTKKASVKKSDFIIIYQEVRNQIAKNSTIQHAWQKNSIFSMDPEVTLDKIKKKEAKKAAKKM